MKQLFEDLFLILTVILLMSTIVFVFVSKESCQSDLKNRQETIEEKIVINYEALAQIESNNNPKAANYSTHAYGLYQITPIVLKEYNIDNPKDYIDITKLFDSRYNYLVAHWYLQKRIPEMLKYYGIKDTLENRLICYNAGIKYLVDELELPKETKKYLKKYKELNNVGNQY